MGLGPKPSAQIGGLFLGFSQQPLAAPEVA